MKYSILIMSISALIFSAALAQPEEETSETTGEEITPVLTDTSEDELPPEEEDTGEVISEYSFYEETSDIVPQNPAAVLESFFEALRTGDDESAVFLISEDGLESIDLILDILKDNIDSNEEMIMNRLSAAGYTATADEIDDWNAQEYLQATVVLPVMKSRYMIYEMQVGEFEIDNDEITVPLVFSNASGLELPFEAQLVQDNDGFWKVTTFIGLNSFP